MGRFFLIGGGPAARTEGEPFMRRLVAEAGGSQARLTLITAASSEPEVVNACYWDLFAGLGVTDILSPDIRSREDAQNLEMAGRVAESTAVFICGGAQARLLERLSGTAMESALRAVAARGGLLAGTSCGTSVMGNPVILDGGTRDPHLREEMVEVGPGFGLLSARIILDTHCSSRGRLPRMISLLLSQPSLQGIGLDEDTALLIDDHGMAEVIGYNAVYVLNMRDRGPRRAGFHLDCLQPGARYDLRQTHPARVEPLQMKSERMAG